MFTRRVYVVCMNNERCSCGNLFPEPKEGSCAAGYAVLDCGIKICYPCADKRQVEDLKDRSKPFCAYVGKGIITTWTGGKLMTITRSRSCELTRMSYTHSRGSYRSIHAVDVHGGHWHGRGSEGICIRLRPCKSPVV